VSILNKIYYDQNIFIPRNIFDFKMFLRIFDS